jgi:hypothetical protein
METGRENQARSRLRHTHSKESVDTLITKWQQMSKAKWGKWLRRGIVSDACELFQRVQLLSHIDGDFVKELEAFGMIEPLQKMQRLRNLQNPSAAKQSYVAMSGSMGETLYDQTHRDIDYSEIEVVCATGGLNVELREAIWWEWAVRKQVTLDAEGHMHETVEVDSDCYDGDHRLVIRATENATSGTVTFKSVDV